MSGEIDKNDPAFKEHIEELYNEDVVEAIKEVNV